MNLTQIRLLNLLYWCLAFTFLIFFIVSIVPKKGVNWGDVGVYYAVSNNYLFGKFNEYGLDGLTNALLIKFNFGYLSLSRFFNLLQFLAGFLFVFSLRLKTNFYWLAPIAVTLMLASSPIQVLSYETSGSIFLLLGTSLLFVSINYSFSRFWKNLWYGLSAFLFCHSSVTNLMLVPTLLVNAFILFFIFPKIRNKTFIITYIVSALINLYLIIFKVHPLFEHTVLYFPGYVQQTTINVVIDSLMLPGFILSGFVVTKLLLLSFEIFFGSVIINAKKLSCNFALILATLIIWFGLRYEFPINTFFAWNNSLLVYGLSYLGCIFAIYGWRFYKDNFQLFLGLALLFQIEYFLIMTGGTDIAWTTRSLGTASEITLIVIMWLEYFWARETGNYWKKVAVALIFAVTSWYYPLSMQMSYAYGQFPAYDSEKITSIPRLNGLYTDPGMVRNLEKVVATYNLYDCQNKLFITRARSPLLYYIFNRIGYSPLFYYDAKADLQRLINSKNGYCYFGDFIFVKVEQTHAKNIAMTDDKKLYEWLLQHSKKIITIQTKCVGCAVGSFVKVYVG